MRRAKPDYRGIPNDPEFGSPAVLAMAVSRSNPCQKTSPPWGDIDPDFRIPEGVDETDSVYHVLDSWGSLNVLSTEDVVLVVSGLCVALVGASYVFLAKAIRFAWQNRQYVTAGNIKWVGWFTGLVLSLAYFIGYIPQGGRGDWHRHYDIL